ncbi:lytic transglycosylase domain-containing protein [Treponema sp. OMZ 840]|uniref:flagellar assembly lytic transglycosylase n=1 Tax=Treponema sp. OMZ 840 TaxID=244313 RepID=UPI003D8C95F1
MRYVKLFFLLAIPISLIACASRKSDFSAKMYFDGLNALHKGDNDKAVYYFRKSQTEDTFLPAILSKEELIPLLYKQGNYNEIIDLSHPESTTNQESAQLQPDSASDTDFFTDALQKNNRIRRFRLASMIYTQHPNTETELLNGLFSGPFTSEDVRLFEDTDFDAFFSSLDTAVQNHIRFKTALYRRNYAKALDVLKKQISSYDAELTENEAEFFLNVFGQSISGLTEVCAALLHGSRNNTERNVYARQLIGLLDRDSFDTEKRFYLRLYAARLYARTDTTEAFKQFESAIESAPDKILFDKALWYYLDSALKVSGRTTITLLQKYGPQWHDASYFDDVLELLSYNLLASRNWKGYYSVYETLSAYMSAETLSKYAFIAGRLAETGLLAGDMPNADYMKAYKISYENSEGSLYYRLLAAERLDIPFSDIETSLLHRKKKQSIPPNPQAERLLAEYIKQGFEDKLYPAFFRFKDFVGEETAIRAAKVLTEKTFYPEALRTAVWSFGKSDDPIKKSQLEMLYPRFYADITERLCTQYQMPEYIVYALIRSESFFDKNINSSAGAVGLTQLMKTTASDIARKLKLRNYDLTDAATNMEFGVFYLNELIGRLNGSVLLALFSYNAGITKVRRWNTEYPELSKDLLLEVLPYKETRQYGQKILTAAALYACLYYNKTTHDIVREIMQ